MERRLLCTDRIRLDRIIYEPTNERLPKQSLEEVASRCLTIEAGLEEDGIIIVGLSLQRLRNIEVPIACQDLRRHAARASSSTTGE